MSFIEDLNNNKFFYFISRMLILSGMVLFFFGVSSFIGMYVCQVFFGISFEELSGIMNKEVISIDEINGMKVFQLIASMGAFLIPAFLFPKAINKKPIFYLGITTKSNPIFYGFAILLMLVSGPFISGLYQWNSQLHLPEQFKAWEDNIRAMEASSAHLTELFTQANNISGLCLNILLIALVPAITEEILFRGCLQNFVRQVFYNPHIAILFSAIIFSAFHGQFLGFFPRMLLGIFLGYVFVYSGSIWVSVAAHFFNNMLAVVSVYLQKNYKMDIAFLDENYQFPWLIVVLSFVSAITIIYLMKQIRSNYTLHEA